MLARSKAVDAKIDAGAGEIALLEIADLDLVGDSAARLHTEVGEDPLLRMEIRNPGLFLNRAQAAAIDLVFVSGIPVVRGRDFRLEIFDLERCRPL